MCSTWNTWGPTLFLRGPLCLGLGVEETEEGHRAGLVENDLEPARVRHGAGFASRRGYERVLESCSGGAVVGLGLTVTRRGFHQSVDFCLELTNGPVSFGRHPSELAASVVVGFGEEGLAVPFGQFTGVDKLDRFVGQVERCAMTDDDVSSVPRAGLTRHGSCGR